MKIFKHLAALALLWVSTSVFGAGSSIDPTQPVYGALMSSIPIRTNFAAAFADINNLIELNSGSTPPLSPVEGQYWLNTSTNPAPLEMWDGLAWVVVGDLNYLTHNWSITCAQMPQLSFDLVSIGHSCAMTVQSINGQAISLGGPFALTGAYSFTGTLTGNSSVTFPTSGTLATVGQLQTALPSTSVLYKGTGAAGGAQAAVPGTDYLAPGGPLGTPSSGNPANLSGTALSLIAGGVNGETFPTSGQIVGTTDTQTLSNKTLVAPNLGTPSALNLQNATGTPQSLNLQNATGTPQSINLQNATGYPPCTTTTGGVVPTPPNNTTTFLRGDCTWSSASGGTSNYIVKTAAYTANAADNIFADTSGGAFTLTLPASPSEFAQVCISDAAGTFGTNMLTVSGNGSNIMGSSANMTASTPFISFCLMYYTSTPGWRIK